MLWNRQQKIPMKNPTVDNISGPLWIWIRESCNSKVMLRQLWRLFHFPFSARTTRSGHCLGFWSMTTSARNFAEQFNTGSVTQQWLCHSPTTPFKWLLSIQPSQTGWPWLWYSVLYIWKAFSILNQYFWLTLQKK